MKKTAISTLEIEYFHITLVQEGIDRIKIDYYLDGEYAELEAEFAIVEKYLLRKHKDKVEEFNAGYWDEGNEDYQPHRIYTIEWAYVAEHWLYRDNEIQLEILNYLLKK